MHLALTSVLLRFPRSVWTGPALAPSGLPAATWAAYRAESQFISADGRTVQFNVNLTAGDPGSAAALRQVPAIRTAVAAVARQPGATAYGVAAPDDMLN